MNKQDFYKAVDSDGMCAAYGLALGRPSWGVALQEKIPGYMQAGVINWVLFGECSGHFLAALVEGNLFRAVERADDANRKALVDYVYFFFNYAPSDCYGSSVKVEEWRERGGYFGKEA